MSKYLICKSLAAGAPKPWHLWKGSELIGAYASFATAICAMDLMATIHRLARKNYG
jgi:hypothetical protein